MPLRTVGAHGVHQEKTELSNLFSLFSPFPPVECLSWLECKNLLPIVLHADDNAAITAAFRESWSSRQGGCTAALNAA